MRKAKATQALEGSFVKSLEAGFWVVLVLAWLPLAPGRVAAADVGADDADTAELTARAAPVSALPAPKEWEVLLSGYLFAASVVGNVSAEDVTADFDVGFIDIMKKFQMGGMGYAEVRRGSWGLAANALGLKLKDDFDSRAVTVGVGPATFSKGPLKFGVPRVQTTVGPADVDVHMSMVAVELMAYYRALSMPLSEIFSGVAEDDPRRFDLDLFAGGRLYWTDVDIDVKIPPVKVPGFDISVTNTRTPLLRRRQPIQFPDISVPGVTFGGLDDDFDETEWWVDPIVGLRVRTGITDRLAVTMIGDVGGFGIGSASNLSWEVWGILSYALNERWTLQAGARAIDIDKDFGGGKLEITLYGPTLGVQYRF